MPANVPAAFARRLKAEREARGWSQRELARRAGLEASTTVSRAERGHDICLSGALAIAAALRTGLTELAGPFSCDRCSDLPPPGFTCNSCGATGTEVAGDGR